jgi:hypothetical protein
LELRGKVNRANAEIKSRAVFRRIKQPLGLASAILVLALFGVLSYDNISHFAQRYEGPFECDEFGYLRQARLFQERGFFGGLDTAIQDATTSYLVAKAKALTPPVPEWSQIVAPDCHHFKKATDRVILQYPPGTGLLLSFFSEGYQEHGAFNLVCTVLVAGLAIVALASANVTASFLVGILGAFCLQGLRQFDISFSIPGSVLLLVVLAWLTAGAMAMKPAQWRWPLHALMGFVLGASINFRIANGFLVFGFAAAYAALIKRHCFLVFRFAGAVALLKRPTHNTLAAPTAFAAAFLIGAAPFLAANAINAGSIFSTTYDTYDTMPPSLSWDFLKRSLYFYFVSHDGTRFFSRCNHRVCNLHREPLVHADPRLRYARDHHEC